MYVSGYINRTVREARAAAGICYANEADWVRIASDAPLILLLEQRSAKSIRCPRVCGGGAARVIRLAREEELPLDSRDLPPRRGLN